MNNDIKFVNKSVTRDKEYFSDDIKILIIEELMNNDNDLFVELKNKIFGGIIDFNDQVKMNRLISEMLNTEVRIVEIDKYKIGDNFVHIVEYYLLEKTIHKQRVFKKKK